MRNADMIVIEGLLHELGKDYPVDELVGLIETSIGKMVPIMPKEVQERDILRLYAEPYNKLILDKKAFKSPIPPVLGLAPKDSIKAWVDRKSYIHNFGHVAAAYAGFLFNSSQQYSFEVLANPNIKSYPPGNGTKCQGVDA
jgi:mannitol-1-phosphate 5-dehydrogenase